MKVENNDAKIVMPDLALYADPLSNVISCPSEKEDNWILRNKIKQGNEVGA